MLIYLIILCHLSSLDMIRMQYGNHEYIYIYMCVCVHGYVWTLSNFVSDGSKVYFLLVLVFGLGFLILIWVLDCVYLTVEFWNLD